MRLSEPRVSSIVDDETGGTLVATTIDNSHDMGGQNYEFTFLHETQSLIVKVRVGFRNTVFHALKKKWVGKKNLGGGVGKMFS